MPTITLPGAAINGQEWAAFTYLRTGWPGPVLLELSVDVASAQFDDKLSQFKVRSSDRRRVLPRDIEEHKPRRAHSVLGI